MMIIGVPPSDEAFMLKMTQEIFGPGDPDVVKQTDTKGDASTFGAEREQTVDLFATAQELFEYFGAITDDRQKNPKDDVASVIANGMVDGQPIGEREAMSYYIIIATAGHDTTSSTTAGGLLQLLKNPEQMAKLKANIGLVPNVVEEVDPLGDAGEALHAHCHAGLQIARQDDQGRRRALHVLLVRQSRRRGVRGALSSSRSTAM